MMRQEEYSVQWPCFPEALEIFYYILDIFKPLVYINRRYIDNRAGDHCAAIVTCWLI